MAKKKSPSPVHAPSPVAGAAPARARRAGARRSTAARETAPPEPGGATTPVPIDTAADASVSRSDEPRHTPSYEEIAEAAYHRFLQRGGGSGRDFDDWIAAEQELRSARERSTS